MNCLNSTPLAERAAIAGMYMMDNEHMMEELQDDLPSAKTSAEFGAMYSGQTFSAICKRVAEAKEKLDDVMRRKAQRTMKVQPLQEFLVECEEDWKWSVGRPDAKYPYTAEHVIAMMGATVS
jgi:hypothetical protein